MEKNTITWIKREVKTAKSGKPYTSLSLKSKEHGDSFINGFGNKDNQNWKEGDVVELNVSEKEFNGKTYLNFDTPKKEDKQSEVLNKLTSLSLAIAGMKLTLEIIKEAVLTPEIKTKLADKERGYHYPTTEEEGIDLDLPF